MRQEERRAQTSRRLLEAAAEVFGRLGFRRATVDDVAEAAGYTKGAVYANFGGKDALFLALLDHHLDEQLDAVDRLLTVDPERDLLADLGEAAAEGDREMFGLLMLEFWQYASRNEEARSALADRYAVMRAKLADAMGERDEARGRPRPRPPADVASLVLAIDAGLFLQRLIDPGAVTAGLRSEAITDLIDPDPPP